METMTTQREVRREFWRVHPELSHEKIRDFLMEADMDNPGLMEDCGSCDCMHPRWFGGDCRNDTFRF